MAAGGSEFENLLTGLRLGEPVGELMHVNLVDRIASGELLLVDLLVHLESVEQRGQRGRLALEHPGGDGLGAVLLLGGLDLFPLHHHLLGGVQFSSAEDMRVPADELVVDLARHGFEIEKPLLLRELSVEDHLDEHIAQLLAHVRHVEPVDGVQKFGTLLDQADGQRLVRLHLVPRATSRGTQEGDGTAKIFNSAHVAPQQRPSTASAHEKTGIRQLIAPVFNAASHPPPLHAGRSNHMRLLVTNDDGLDSVFLHALVHALVAAGHTLWVAAPLGEQSWIGAAKSRHRPVRSARAECGFGCPTWSVDGTPSDCVNIALAHLLPTDGPAIEAVISGINVGRNTSLAFIPASGTIGGAWEGALHGLPAAAISQDVVLEDFAYIRAHAGQPPEPLHAAVRISALHAASTIPPLLARATPRSFTVHNFNYPFPGRPDAAVRRTVPARRLLPKLFGAPDDSGVHRFAYNHGEDISPAEPLTDNAALDTGAISHTVLDYTRLGH